MFQGHQPRHGSREIMVITAALSTCDPGFILTETLPKLQQANIRVTCFALQAELHICRKLAEATAGNMGVCLDEQHFRDWLLAQCTPLPKNKTGETGCEMIPMGFPSRTSQEVATLVHAGRHKTLLARTAFTCPQCQGKNSELPADCAVCGLKLVLAPHLARSFHHLFPVPTFVERSSVPTTTQTTPASLTSSSTAAAAAPGQARSDPSVADASGLDHRLVVSSQDSDRCCYACLRPLLIEKEGILSFQCPDCQNLYCVDCDTFLHSSLHNCPGCLSR